MSELFSSGKLKVVGMDPSTSNFGICKATVDIYAMTFTVDDLILIETESESKKGVRKDSDDLRRAILVYQGMVNAVKDAQVVFSEIPFCNPGTYASANFNAGLVTGVLAGSPKRIIQVFPQEVKQLFCGSRHAAKEEMIDEAMKRFPEAPWSMRKFKGHMVPTKKNEHLADAVAVINAGIQSDQFLQLISIFK